MAKKDIMYGTMTHWIDLTVVWDMHVEDFFEKLKKYHAHIVAVDPRGGEGGNASAVITFPSAVVAFNFLKDWHEDAIYNDKELKSFIKKI